MVYTLPMNKKTILEHWTPFSSACSFADIKPVSLKTYIRLKKVKRIDNPFPHGRYLYSLEDLTKVKMRKRRK